MFRVVWSENGNFADGEEMVVRHYGTETRMNRVPPVVFEEVATAMPSPGSLPTFFGREDVLAELRREAVDELSGHHHILGGAQNIEEESDESLLRLLSNVVVRRALGPQPARTGTEDSLAVAVPESWDTCLAFSSWGIARGMGVDDISVASLAFACAAFLAAMSDHFVHSPVVVVVWVYLACCWRGTVMVHTAFRDNFLVSNPAPDADGETLELSALLAFGSIAVATSSLAGVLLVPFLMIDNTVLSAKRIRSFVESHFLNLLVLSCLCCAFRNWDPVPLVCAVLLGFRF